MARSLVPAGDSLANRSVVLACLILPLPAILSLTGCGLAETGTAATAEAASKAEEVRQGLATEARVREQVEEAKKKAAEQLEAAEAQ